MLSNHELPNSPILHWGGGCFHKMSPTGVLGVVFTLIWNLSCFPGSGTKRVMSLILQSVWVANILFQVLQYVVLSDLYPCGHFRAPLGTFLCNWRMGRKDVSFSLAPHKLYLSWEDLGKSGFIPVQGFHPGTPWGTQIKWVCLLVHLPDWAGCFSHCSFSQEKDSITTSSSHHDLSSNLACPHSHSTEFKVRN